MKRVKITRLPKSKAEGVPPYTNQVAPSYIPNEMGIPDIEVRSIMTPVKREFANVEAEKGETVYVPDKMGLPAHYKIGGKRHSEGGTPLSIPDDSFIFSDTPSLKIKDKDILAEFGKNPKGKRGYTPADLAKKYDINKYREILADKSSSKMQIDTAEMMIANYNMKLAKLALVQEAKKGFPEGIPAVSLPYLFMTGTDPEAILPVGSSSSPGRAVPAQQGQRFQMGGTRTKTPVIPDDALVIERQTGESDQDFYDRLDQLIAQNPGHPTYFKTGNKYQSVQRGAPRIVTSRSGMQNYMGDYSQDLAKGNQLFQKLVDNDLAYYDSKAGGWKIKGSAGTSKVLSLEDRDVLTRLANSSGEGLGWEGKPIILQHGKGNPYGMYGWANPDLLEYKYWKSTTGKSDTGEFESMSKDQRKELRADMIDFYMKNDKFNPGFKGAKEEYSDLLGNPDKLYSSDSPLMNRDFNLVKGIQTVFGDQQGYYPGEGKDYKIGLEHLKEFKKQGPYQFSDLVPERTETEAPDIVPNQVELSNPPRTAAPWWTQDVIETLGRTGDYYSINKYLPWAPRLFPHLADPTFVDPTRELAANAEQAAIAFNATTAFGSGAQSLGARLSRIQGQGAATAADTLSRYNNQNVGTANQFEQFNTEILNRYGIADAQIAQDLYDKTTVANQNYDDAKRKARFALRQTFEGAITNRAQTQALNTMYPHYQVDPTTGGFVNFTKGTPLKPGTDTPDTSVDLFNYYRSNPEYSGISDENLVRLITSKGSVYNMDQDVDTSTFNPMEAYMSMFNGLNR